MRDREYRALCANLISKCKANGYSKWLIESIAALCASTDNMEESIKYLCTLCDKKLSSKEFFTKAMQIAGLED